MSEKEHTITRRRLLRLGLMGAGAAMLAACQPKIVEVTKVVEKEVEKEVEKVVKETVIVAGTPQVVEKVITAAPAPLPTKGPVDLVWWSGAPLNDTLSQWKPYQDKVFEIMADVLPGTTVTYMNMGWDAVLRQNLLTALMGGTAPDLIVGESFIQPDARIGAYLALDDALKEAKIYDNLIPGVHRNVAICQSCRCA